MKIEDTDLINLVKESIASGLESMDWLKKGDVRHSLNQRTTEQRRFFVVVEGQLEIDSSDGKKEYKTGSGFILEPMAWYEFLNEDFRLLELVICGSRIEIHENVGGQANIDKRMHVFLKSTDEARCSKIDEKIKMLKSYSGEKEGAFRAALLRLILLHVTELFEAGPVSGKRLRHVFETLVACILDNYLNQSFTRLAVAAKFDISESYINTMISWGLGCKFKEFLTLKRLEYSRKTLKESKKQIKELAPLFGYADATIFIINFRQRYKLTPNKMREMMKREELDPEERRQLHYMNKVEELSGFQEFSSEKAETNEEEKTLLFLSNMTDGDISVFAHDDKSKTLIRSIPENTRIILSAPRGGILEIQDKAERKEMYKIAEKPCIVYYQ